MMFNLCVAEDSEARKGQQKHPKATAQRSQAREGETDEARWL